MESFEEEIKYIESELLRLKTAQRYTSTKNVDIATFQNIHTGLYRVTFEKDSFMADYYPGYITPDKGTWASVYARTTNTNTQVVEVDSTTFGDDPDGSRVDNYITLSIVSSVPVVSVTRIS